MPEQSELPQQKNLHFGHVGAMFIHADIFARFLEIESEWW